VCLVPASAEKDALQVPGADPFDQQHVTLGYYGDSVDPDTLDALHAAAERISSRVDPITASVMDRSQLGDDDPPADVLMLEPDAAFERARMELPAPPADVKVYPTYKPHLTVGYGIGDDALQAAAPDDAIDLDRVAVVNNDDWKYYPLGGTEAPEREVVEDDDFVDPDAPLDDQDSLEAQVSKIWGPTQFDWTIGRSPEGWFYYCGEMATPQSPATWKHGGHEPTLVGALQKMIDLKDEPSNRLSDEARMMMAQIEAEES
jgi:hypothetical protein